MRVVVSTIKSTKIGDRNRDRRAMPWYANHGIWMIRLVQIVFNHVIDEPRHERDQSKGNCDGVTAIRRPMVKIERYNVRRG
jgi:hypothetical protein